ncbi:hypothetical protein CV102_21880 [Natronococcus pandeyae]|uniref:Uncharacterized protein n=1 Tax=Natronococcus pandeyae TaxID=2055836 RepID=A0A8J8Q0Y0_9EURY|nr:HTH domain-containing protein [Natronococcus pandeyae]TYL36478.1 hypothetical protein CV102_21880 [Natronococcus pandeyae]
MSVDNVAGVPAVDVSFSDDVRVDCYVRTSLPGALVETVSDVVRRLERICEHGPLTECRISQWPREHHTTVADDEHSPARDELVTEFERWADRRGYTLEPAFRREETPPPPLSIGSDEPEERIRVPILALALYENDHEMEHGTLRGVIPCTKRSATGEQRTYSVDEWLSAVETRDESGFDRTPNVVK